MNHTFLRQSVLNPAKEKQLLFISLKKGSLLAILFWSFALSTVAFVENVEARTKKYSSNSMKQDRFGSRRPSSEQYGKYESPGLFSVFTAPRKSISGLSIKPMVSNLSLLSEAKIGKSTSLLKSEETYEQGYGLTLGYTDSPRSGSGYNINLGYSAQKLETRTDEIIMAEANWLYGLFPRLVFKIGGNVGSLRQKSEKGELINKPLSEVVGMGGQAGFNIPITRQIAAEVAYQQTTWEYDLENQVLGSSLSYKHTISGMVMGLSFTF